MTCSIRHFLAGLQTRRWAAAALLLLVMGALHAAPSRAQDPYPAPSIPEIDPIQDATLSGETSVPYPAPETGDPGVIGQDGLTVPDASSAPTLDTPAAEPAESPAGLYFLWGSFLAALLIFATAVVGSVVLFARRVE